MTTSSQQIQFRQRNRTYYADLEQLHQLLVPPGLRVLEVGCGTGDLNDLYSLALAQALQRHASDAAQTLTQIKSLDPSNPNALLGLGVVELYRFRPGQAQVVLDQAAKMSPNNSTLRTLRIVASALRLDLPQTLHLLRS